MTLACPVCGTAIAACCTATVLLNKPQAVTQMVRAASALHPNAGISSKASKPLYSLEFLEFWGSYPRKKDKATAARAFAVAVAAGVGPHVLIAGALAYAKDPQRNPEFTKYPATWINARGWEDEAEPTAAEIADAKAKAEMASTRRFLDGDPDE